MSSIPITVLTNSFEITRLPIKTYHQYDVVIQPEVKQFKKRQQLIHRLQNEIAHNIFHPRALYDGKAILYSSHQLKLPGGNSGTFCFTFSSPGEVRPETKGAFEVRLNLTAGGLISPSALSGLVQGKQLPSATTATAINLLQLIIKQSSNQKIVHNARAFFVEDGKKSLGRGLEIWKGFYQSVRPAMGRMIINIDTSATVVYQSGNLLEVCVQYLSSGGRKKDVRDLRLRPRDADFLRLQKHLKNLQIKVKTIRGTKVIRELTEAAGRYEFDLDDGSPTTVAEHYLRAHQIRLSYPDIIGVQTSGKNAPHPVIIPLELCELLPGQFYKKQLPPDLTNEMVRFTTVKPRDRLDKIVGRDRRTQSPITMFSESEFVRESGMQVSNSPIRVDAKLLRSPPVVISNGAEIMPQNGKWDMRSKRVFEPRGIQYWAVVNFDESSNINHFQPQFVALMQACRDLGLRIGSDIPTAYIPGSGDVENSMMEVISRTTTAVGKPLEPTEFLIFVILPDSAESIKHRVKFWGNCRMGILTQCFRSSKFRAANNQFLNLVVLKLNARLGGVNAHVQKTQVMEHLAKQPYMLIGADVSHPGPQARKPSITSLVWSVDKYGVRYMSRQRIQNPRMEMIQHLKEMMIEAFQSFYIKMKVMPKIIIFFRDGVSEGEYEQVEKLEISAIQDAMMTIAQDPQAPPEVKEEWGNKRFPKLVYIVVGKRHHNSLFPDERSARSSDGKTGNCPPGTLVDNGITNPTIRDFFLQAHGAVQGTSRSGHYIILRDDIFGLQNTGAIQEICFALCHIYANCTRSISIPAPVYYADMACTSAASHFDPHNQVLQYGFTDTSSVASGGSESTFNLQAWEEAFKPVHKRLLNLMHFL